MHINSKSLSELENSKTEVSLKQFLKKPDLLWKRIMGETYINYVLFYKQLGC